MFFAIIISIGAFFEGFIMSSFTSEIGNMQRRINERDTMLSYCKYTMIIHRFPDKMSEDIKHYINFTTENLDQTKHK